MAPPPWWIWLPGFRLASLLLVAQRTIGGAPETAPVPGEVTLYKHRFSGFYETELDAVLTRRGIKHLIFTGCTTSVCVESTVRDALFRDYTCLVLADCTAEPLGDDLPRSNHDASLFVMQAVFGWVSDSAALISALAGQRVPVPA